jgi:uncharacterized protein YkwD
VTWLAIWQAIKSALRFVRGRSAASPLSAAASDPGASGATDSTGECGAEHQSAPPLVTASVPTILLALLNRERMIRQVPRCNLDCRLTVAAEKHCEAMAEVSFCSHLVAGEPCLQDRVLASGFAFLRVCELVAEGQETALDAIRDWLSEDANRRVLLDPDCRQVGFGLAVTPAGRHFWTAILSDSLAAGQVPSEADPVLLLPPVVRGEGPP